MTSQAQTSRRARANARLMARPKPCAAPVTMTVLPLKSSHARSVGVVAASSVQRLERLRALAALDVVDQLDEPRGERRRARRPRAPSVDDDAELRVDFRRPLSHREIAPDAAVCLRRRRLWATSASSERVGGAGAARSAGRPSDRSRRMPPASRRAPSRPRESLAPARCRGRDTAGSRARRRSTRSVSAVANSIAPYASLPHR